MASSITSSFAGKATDFYASAMLEGATLSTAGITIDNKVQYKYVPRGFDMTNIIVSGSTCSWSDAGTTTVSESPKEVKAFHVNKTECYKDYYNSWNGVTANDGLPSDVESAIGDKVAASMKARIETDLWRLKSSGALTGQTGGTYTSGQFDGFIALLNGNATEIATGTLTVSNILTKMGEVYDAIPDAVKSIINQDPSKGVIFVSFKALGLYKRAVANSATLTVQTAPTPTFLDIEVRGVDVFTNVIVAGLRESFHVASNIGLNDASINIKDMYPVTLERNARVEAEWKYVPAVTNVSQIVLAGF